MEQIEDKKFTVPSIITDPFFNDKVYQVWLYWQDNKWRGWIEFKNGNTSGKQDLIADISLDAMVQQFKTINESLKNK